MYIIHVNNKQEDNTMDNNNLTLNDLESIMVSSDCTCDVKFTADGRGYLFVKTFDGRKFCSRFLKNPRKAYDALKAKKLFY